MNGGKRKVTVCDTVFPIESVRMLWFLAHNFVYPFLLLKKHYIAASLYVQSIVYFLTKIHTKQPGNTCKQRNLKQLNFD